MISGNHIDSCSAKSGKWREPAGLQEGKVKGKYETKRDAFISAAKHNQKMLPVLGGVNTPNPTGRVSASLDWKWNV